jgi:GNAT superfamily N-acetyltransferase
MVSLMQTQVNVRLLTAPSPKHLRQVKRWLKLEYDQQIERLRSQDWRDDLDFSAGGLFNNCNTINDCHRDGTLLFAVNDDVAVSFLCWSQNGRRARLCIRASERGHRRKGIGAALASEVIRSLQEGGVTRLTLETTFDAQNFFRRLDFIDDTVPKRYNEHSIYLVKTLPTSV